MRGLVQTSMLPGGLFTDTKAKALYSENNLVLGGQMQEKNRSNKRMAPLSDPKKAADVNYKGQVRIER